MSGGVVGIIPAAGKGIRLAPYPSPKELFPIGAQLVRVNGTQERRPKVVSQYLIERMAAANITRIYMVVGEHKHDLLRYYGNGRKFGVDMCYLYQEEPRGMPQAIDLAYPWLGDETVVLGMPDTIILPGDAYLQLLTVHHQWKADLTLGLFPTDNPSKFGMVQIDGGNNIVYHVDKPKNSNLTLMWGIACWGKRFTELLNSYVSQGCPQGSKEGVLGDVFQMAMDKGYVVMGHVVADGAYLDVGTYAEIEVATRLAMDGSETRLRSG